MSSLMVIGGKWALYKDSGLTKEMIFGGKQVFSTGERVEDFSKYPGVNDETRAIKLLDE